MINQAGKKIDYKSERGITLITLTITIIILVILASITVGVAFGDNGLLKGSEKIEQVKRIEKYKTTIERVAYEQYTDYIMEDKQGSLRDKTKNKIKTLDFVKEANNGAEDDEINVITNELYLIVVKLDSENIDVIHNGENDAEPLPKIAREYVGKENGKYKIKASATVVKTEKTTSITTLRLIETNSTIENYEEGKEITFEVDRPGKYWIEATTNVGKTIKEPVVIDYIIEDSVKAQIEVIKTENQTVNIFDDTSTVITVKLNGNNYKYQWYYNDNKIGDASDIYSGEKTIIMNIPTNTMNMNNYKGGTYKCVISDSVEEQEIKVEQTVTYNISVANQMKNFAKRVNKQGITFLDATIKQTADIDLSSVCGEKIGSWEPIGNSTTNFRGKYLGQQYNIKNLYISKNESIDYNGIFGVTLGANLNNITVYGEIYETKYAGGIVGFSANSKIDKCTNHINISNSKYRRRNYRNNSY